MSTIANTVLETIGNTPIVKLNRVIGHSPHTFYAKLESFNPGQSIKDRAALAIVEYAEKRGDLKPGNTIIEATSGNTGLGLAMIGAVKGYPTILVMPDKVSEEKRAILRAFGARVVVCPTAVEPDDPRSYYKVTEKLVEITPNSFHANQYFNEDNLLAHYDVTGPEIASQMGADLDVIVAGVGTGGTASGLGRYFKEHHPEVKLIGVDPIGSILYDLFHYQEVREPAHTYKIEGVGEDMLPGNVHFDVMDDFVKVSDREAFQMCQDLIKKEGICCGPSCAMAVVGAMKWAANIEEPQNILVILPDHGRAYLSKAFNDDWLRENDFLPNPMAQRTILDLLRATEAPTELLTADVGDSVAKVVGLMKGHGISQLPVFSGDELVGIIDEGDLILPLAEGKLKPEDPIIHLAHGNVIWTQLDDTLVGLSEHFDNGYVALTHDNAGNLRIVTRIDMLNFMSRILGD